LGRIQGGCPAEGGGEGVGFSVFGKDLSLKKKNSKEGPGRGRISDEGGEKQVRNAPAVVTDLGTTGRLEQGIEKMAGTQKHLG